MTYYLLPTTYSSAVGATFAVLLSPIKLLVLLCCLKDSAAWLSNFPATKSSIALTASSCSMVRREFSSPSITRRFLWGYEGSFLDFAKDSNAITHFETAIASDIA